MIRSIVVRVDHPRTNGKIEKLFGAFERNVRKFDTIDEFMSWYNYVKPHGAFDVGRLETPGMMYYRRLPENRRMALVDPSLLIHVGGETICGKTRRRCARSPRSGDRSTQGEEAHRRR